MSGQKAAVAGDAAPPMSRDDMRRMFRFAREEPVRAAFALGADNVPVLSMDKRKPPRALERQLHEAHPRCRDSRWGTVAIDPDDPKRAVFTVNRAAPGMARKLAKAVKGTGISKVRIVLEDGSVCDAADEEDADGQEGAQPGGAPGDGGQPAPDQPSTGQPSTGQASTDQPIAAAPVAEQPDAAAGLRATLSLLAERIGPLAAADPSWRARLLPLATEARDQLRAGDLGKAAAGVEALRKALEQAEAAPSAAGGAGGRECPCLVDSLGEDGAESSGSADAQQAAYRPGGDAVPGAPGGGAAGAAPGGPPAKKQAVKTYRYKVLVPRDMQTLEEMYRLFERTVFGRELNLRWECRGYCDMAQNRGKVVPFEVSARAVEAGTDPAQAKRQRSDKAAFDALQGARKAAVQAEADRRYAQRSGEKPGPDAHTKGTGQERVYDQALSGVMQDRELLRTLPPEVAALLGGKGGEYDPKNYAQLVRIVEKLKKFSPEDLQLYKLLPLRATDDLNLFEQSVDQFLAHREELKKALQAQGGTTPVQPQADQAGAEVWKDFDGSKIAGMTEDERYALARQKTTELTEAQLKHMAEHPGETLEGFAKSATLLNTPETLGAVGKDMHEALDGNAEGWSRAAAGAGAGAKLSGWLLAVAGVVYVASWLTGVGELATIAAGAGYLLGATLTLSAVESELRIEAASKAKTPEEFKRNVEAAAAARANVAVGLAMIITAAVLHFAAKAAFPEAVQKLKTTLKNVREKVRLVGSVRDLKPPLVKAVTAQRGAVATAMDGAKANAAATAAELEKLSTEAFVERLEKGGAGGFLDSAKVPAEQKVDFRSLLGSPEGRAAIDGYKAKLVQALKSDVPAGIDRLGKQYLTGIDEFVREVEAAANHDQLDAALAKLEELLGEEHAKQFMQGEKDLLVQQQLQKAAVEPPKPPAKPTKPPEKPPEKLPEKLPEKPPNAPENPTPKPSRPDPKVLRQQFEAAVASDPVKAYEALHQLAAKDAIGALSKVTDDAALAKLSAEALKNGNRRLARASDPVLRAKLASDPAVGRPRPSERDMALRLESALDVDVDRYQAGQGQKGDFKSTDGKTVYDGVSPGPNETIQQRGGTTTKFDAGFRNYQDSVLQHIKATGQNDPAAGRGYAVVDLSELNLTEAQVQKTIEAVNKAIDQAGKDAKAGVIVTDGTTTKTFDPGQKVAWP